MYLNATFKVKWDGSLSIADKAFNVDSSGNLWSGASNFNDALFSVSNQGYLKAKSGTIGAWNIYSNGLLGSTSLINGSTYGIGLDARAAEIANNHRLFAIGLMPNGISGGWDQTAFWIKADGQVHCGNIEATGGTIGPCKIINNAFVLENYLSLDNGVMHVQYNAADNTEEEKDLDVGQVVIKDKDWVKGWTGYLRVVTKVIVGVPIHQKLAFVNGICVGYGSEVEAGQ